MNAAIYVKMEHPDGHAIFSGWIQAKFLIEHGGITEYLEWLAKAAPLSTYADDLSNFDYLVLDAEGLAKHFIGVFATFDLSGFLDMAFDIEMAGDDLDLEAIDAWLSNGMDWNISDFTEAYVGKFESLHDFAYDKFHENFDVPDAIASYIDYEAYERDLFCSDYWEINNHVFINC